MNAPDGQWVDVNNQAVHLADQAGHQSYGSWINTALCLVVVILWTGSPKTLPDCPDCRARQERSVRTR